MKNIFVAIFFAVLCIPNAYGEEPVPSETTEEVAPIPVEKVEEIEGAKEAKDESKAEEKSEEKAEEKAAEKVPETDLEAVKDAVALWKAIESQDWPPLSGRFHCYVACLCVQSFRSERQSWCEGYPLCLYGYWYSVCCWYRPCKWWFYCGCS
jgi:hypothetical protein